MERADRERIRKNLVQLTRELIADDDVFLAKLQHDRILSDSMVEEIRVEKTKMKRSSSFLSLIQRRGPNAFKSFIGALVESNQDHLAELLDPKLAAKLLAGRKPVHPIAPNRREPHPVAPVGPTRRPQPSAPEQPIVDQEQTMIPINLKTIDEVDIAPYIRSGFVNDYKMTAKPRGRAVIINNETFEDNLSEREGSTMDTVNLSELFKALFFETAVNINCSRQEILDLLETERARESHKMADCFVLIILSHGNEGVIYGREGKNKGAIKIDDIINMFDGTNCPALLGKPKVFLIQACQGSGQTKGQIVSDSAGDNEETMVESQERLLDDTDAKPLVSVHEKQDVIIALSTVPGRLQIMEEYSHGLVVYARFGSRNQRQCIRMPSTGDFNTGWQTFIREIKIRRFQANKQNNK